MGKRKVTFGKKIFAVILAVVLIVCLVPETFLTVTAESGSHSGMYTVEVHDMEDNPISGVKISWVTCEADGLNPTAQEEKISGEDGICEFAEINTILSEDTVERVYFQITDVTAPGYKFDGLEMQTVEKADANGHLEISLSAKEVKSLTGTVTAKESGAALINVSISVMPGDFQTVTDNEGRYTIGGLYEGESYEISASHDDYCLEQKSIAISDGNSCDFELSEKQEDSSFVFLDSSPSIIYSENQEYSNLISGDTGTLGIKYKIVDAKNVDGTPVETAGEIAVIDSTTGRLAIKKAGSITVKAMNAQYIASYTLTIERAEQSEISFDNSNQTIITCKSLYDLSSWKVIGGSQDAEVEYTIEPAEADIAVIKDGKIETQGKEGKFTLYAQKKQTDCYKESNKISCEITVELPEQGDIKFSDEVKSEITYSPEEYKIPLAIGYVDGSQIDNDKSTIYYQVENADGSESVGSEIAEIISESGSKSAELKIKKAGKFKLSATLKRDEYKPVSVEKEITVHKANYPYKEYQKEKVELIYGIQDYEIEKVKDKNGAIVKDGEWKDDNGNLAGAVKYALDVENALGVKIEDGKIKFKDNMVGMVTIRATVEGTDCYNEWYGEYQLEIKYLKVDRKPYDILNADMVIVNGVEWYGVKDDAGSIMIVAPDGYLISDNNHLENVKWNVSIPYYSELQKIYLKKDNEDKITDGINVDENIDIEKPIDLSISYSPSKSNGLYYKDNVTVTLSAKDKGSGIDCFVYNLGINTGTVTVPAEFDEAKGEYKYEFQIAAQYRGEISFKAVDKVGNESEEVNGNTLIVDNEPPRVAITYSKDGLRLIDASNHIVEKADENSRLFYNIPVKVTVDVKESNFDKEDVNVKVNGNKKEIIWSGNESKTGSFILDEDGDYIVTVEYIDKSGNTMQWTSNETDEAPKQGTYNSHKITVDKTKPVIRVAYSNEKAIKGNYYKTDRTATITITETNFDASGVTVDIVTKDITGKAVSNKAQLSSWTHTGNNHTATIALSDNAVYTFDISCEDIAGNEAADYKPDQFVIDKTAPKTSDMNITYSKELKSWEKLINKVTFGYYAYKKGVTVTLKAKDAISGIDKMTWTYEQEDGTSTDKNVKKKTGTISASSITHSGATATATFKLTAKEAEQFRGYISFTATDRAGNTSNAKSDNKRVNIVDTIAPKRTVTYTPAKQVVDAKTMKTKSSYKYSSEGTDSILYYDGPVMATFQITEANFYSDDVVILVNGKRKKPKNWKQNGDKWTGSIKISGDGEYVVTMDYKDRSDKQMKKYSSEKIVIDTKDPVIKVSYENNDSKNSVGNTKYYDGAQTATITIQEHNFRAKDVKAKVTAKDVSGNDIAVMDYASYLSNKNNWTQKGDKYTAQVTYSMDANYTFDISYQDLATREAADYAQDSFTVDQTAPENLTVSYSTSVFEKVLNAVTFGYYNTQMTVTVTAEDATSGIEHFTYSYRKDSGVSSVNAELIDAAIQKADVTQNGNTFTASFKIPEQVLGNGNQFNGTVDFIAYDYAANDSKQADAKRIVVDNIKPVADVTFSDPVREANHISYYAGDVIATVVIHEANFYAEDVVVAVSRDGAPVAVTPSWTDEGTDIHTGTFTLHEDGDYLVTIDYTDTSSNEMDQYVSNQLTIDTEAPTVSVSNVKMNSANKDETYSFTITANDTNFDSGSFHPILTALVQNAQGYYTTETIELGAVRMSEAGKTYSYSIGNLDADAVYKLVCTVSDMAGNEYSKILLSEDNTEYDTVRFSINRNGSTFAIDEKVETLVDQYYVYSVNDDIVIEEINVDPVENYAVKMNGENLTEGSDYTTTLSANEDEWSKRTYVVKKELFDAEGEYNIVVESTDKTETTAYSDVKNVNVSFVVDQTAPVLTVSGLEESGRYQVQEQTVTVIPTDDGGKLNAFQAVVLEANGNPSSDAAGEDDSVRFEMSGEEFEKYLEENNGTITFTVPEGLEKQVLLVCNDMALHTDGTTNECRENFTKVTVSQSGWIIFYANKPLFYSMIAGIVVMILAAGSVIVLITRKRKRKRA